MPTCHSTLRPKATQNAMSVEEREQALKLAITFYHSQDRK